MKPSHVNDTVTVAELRMREALAKPDISPLDAAVIKLQIGLLRPFHEWLDEVQADERVTPREIAISAVNVMGVLIVNLVAMFEDDNQDYVRKELKTMMCTAIDHYSKPTGTVETLTRTGSGVTH